MPGAPIFLIIGGFKPDSCSEHREETPLSLGTCPGKSRLSDLLGQPLRQQKRGKIDVMSTLLVLTNLPDAESAQTLATHLVEQGLAACVNILAPCRSVYRWQDRIEAATEVPLLIKTTAERYAELEAAIQTHHPYELPEIVAVSIERGLPEYLAWVAQTVNPNSSRTTGLPC